jgi:hypothetical protein
METVLWLVQMLLAALFLATGMTKLHAAAREDGRGPDALVR